ncbi:MAG: hypothetical protein ACEY3D_05645 [Rickettsia sp.]
MVFMDPVVKPRGDTVTLPVHTTMPAHNDDTTINRF